MKRFCLYVTLIQRDEPHAEYLRNFEADDLQEVLVQGFETITMVHTAAKAVADTTPQPPA